MSGSHQRMLAFAGLDKIVVSGGPRRAGRRAAVRRSPDDRDVSRIKERMAMGPFNLLRDGGEPGFDASTQIDGKTTLSVKFDKDSALSHPRRRCNSSRLPQSPLQRLGWASGLAARRRRGLSAQRRVSRSLVLPCEFRLVSVLPTPVDDAITRSRPDGRETRAARLSASSTARS
jgi:hypothetical protein